MSPEMAIELGRDALTTAVMLAAPILLSALGAGLLIGMFQAATQINEQTMTFAPKIVAVLVALVIAAPWILNIVLGLAHEVFGPMVIQGGG